MGGGTYSTVNFVAPVCHALYRLQLIYAQKLTCRSIGLYYTCDLLDLTRLDTAAGRTLFCSQTRPAITVI